MRTELEHRKAGGDQPVDELHLLVVSAFELELEAGPGLVYVRHRRLFDEEALEAFGRSGKTNGEDFTICS